MEQQLVILGNGPGVHGIQTYRIETVEALPHVFLANEQRLENLPPVVALADDEGVICEIRVGDQRSCRFAAILTGLFLIPPLVV